MLVATEPRWVSVEAIIAFNKEIVPDADMGDLLTRVRCTSSLSNQNVIKAGLIP